MAELEKNRHARRREKITDIIDLIESTQTYAFRILALIFLVVVELALFIALFKETKTTTELMAAITIIAVLPIVVIRVFDISVLKFSKEGLEMDTLQTKVDEALSKVDRLFVLTMSDKIYKTLSTINGNAPYPCKIDDSFRRQLYYLEDIGYVTPIPSKDLPTGDVESLQEYFQVTTTGKEFIEYREDIPKA
jgi:hypothetical protein